MLESATVAEFLPLFDVYLFWWLMGEGLDLPLCPHEQLRPMGPVKAAGTLFTLPEVKFPPT